MKEKLHQKKKCLVRNESWLFLSGNKDTEEKSKSQIVSIPFQRKLISNSTSDTKDISSNFDDYPFLRCDFATHMEIAHITTNVIIIKAKINAPEYYFE